MLHALSMAPTSAVGGDQDAASDFDAKWTTGCRPVPGAGRKYIRQDQSPAQQFLAGRPGAGFVRAR
jgi:hypothetical protein